MKRSLVLSLALTALLGFMAIANAGPIFRSLINPGGITNFQDQSLDAFSDENNNNTIDAGDRLFGFIRLDDVLVPPADIANQLYSVFSVEFTSLTSLAGPGGTTGYTITWGASADNGTGTSLEELISDPLTPAGSIAAVYELAGGYPTNLINTAPATVVGPLDIFDFTDEIVTLGTRDLIAGLSDPTDFFTGTTPFFPGVGDPFAPGGAALIPFLSTGNTVANFAGGMTVLINDDPLVLYNRLADATNPLTGVPTLHDLTLTLGTATGSNDQGIVDPSGGPTFFPDFRDAAQLRINATVVPEPGSLFLLGSGLIGLIAFGYGRSRKKS